MRNKGIILFCIILLASFLRLYKLGVVPASPDWDEASLGYNAYSILKTGRDEYGTYLPLSIRSFGDYKPPLYTYLSVPIIAVFGLDVFSVRLLSAICGIVSVVGTFYLVKILYSKKEKTNESAKNDQYPIIALLSATLMAISPWNLQFSRAAFEANLGVMLNIWGVYFFIRGLRNNLFYCISSIIFSLALWAYHSERVFVPILIFGLVYFFRKEIRFDINKKPVFVSITIFIIGLLLLVYSFAGGGLSRLQGTSILSNQVDLLKKSVSRISYDVSRNDYIGSLFDNRRIVLVKTLADGYISHFSLKWLFLTGDNARHHAPDMGLLYFVELPFFLIGLVSIGKKKDIASRVLMFWLLISPIAAAPTTGVPHAIRSMVFLPVVHILTAIGLLQFVSYVQKISIKQPGTYKTILLSVFILFSCNIFYYFSMYYDRMDKDYSSYWQYGYKEAVEYSQTHYQQYNKIIISTNLEQPYIFFLFYTKYNPLKYQKNLSTDLRVSDKNTIGFDKYEFRKIDWRNEIKDGTVLYIGIPGEIPFRPGSIKYLDGKPSIAIADRE